MDPVDFSLLLEQDSGPAGHLVSSAYPRGEGQHFRWRQGARTQVRDVVRLAEGAFLFAASVDVMEGNSYDQIIADDDWIHIQFRLKGAGVEQVGPAARQTIGDRACFVSRYPRDSLIRREEEATESWQVACLFLNPSAVGRLLDMPCADLPESVSWIADGAHHEFRTLELALAPKMVGSVNDILTCSLDGGIRRSYMKAKSTELLCQVVKAMSGQDDARASRLSAQDQRRICNVRDIILSEIDVQHSLADLARRVGINRTKLVAGFRQLFGTSVLDYARDAKLSQAREWLLHNQMSVSEAAFRLGFSESSAFTRAFRRRYGFAPKYCRPR